MSEEVKNQTEGKELAVNDDELAGLLATNSKLQAKEIIYQEDKNESSL